MKKFSQEYPHYLYEALEDALKDKLSKKYSSLKEGVLNLVESSVNNPNELVNVQNYISDYIRNSETSNLVNFVEDNDIFNFYLKYQVDIDELCVDKKFFDKNPSTNNIFSLYSFVIDGCKFAVLECLKLIQKEVFST